MSTPLLQQFPALASQPPAFLKDLLSSPPLTEAFLFSLPEVQHLAREVEKLGRENEEIASEWRGLIGLHPGSILPQTCVPDSFDESEAGNEIRRCPCPSGFHPPIAALLQGVLNTTWS
jgi:hypothetical protein